MKKGLQNKKVQWVISVILTSFLLLSLSSGAQKVLATSDSNKPYKDLKIFSEVFHKIQTNYFEAVDTEELIEGSINGMLRTLDPHSSYMNKDIYKEMQIETEGEFGGLGIEITIRNNILTVVSPIEDTPAFAAGIKAGDKIIKVDGVSTQDLSLSEAVKRMRGKKGTEVTITIVRKGLDKPKDITIIRDIIKIKSVKYKKLEDGIGYVRINSFSKSTGADLEKALQKLEEKNISGLVLDLRNNPGGLLSQAVRVSDTFMGKGSLIVYTKGRKENQNLKYTAHPKNSHIDYPMIVMVNEGSASASEIVAGALQDTKRAVILGAQTFGKGSVQTIIPLSNGAGLRITTARYFTPNGQVIQGKGITPDILVEADPHIPEAISSKIPKVKIIREKDLKRHIEGEKPSANSAEKDDNEKEVKEKDDPIKKDVQLQSAVNLLKGWKVFQSGLTKR